MYQRSTTKILKFHSIINACITKIVCLIIIVLTRELQELLTTKEFIIALDITREIPLSVLCIIFSLMLLYGIFTNKQAFMVPYMVLMLINTVRWMLGFPPFFIYILIIKMGQLEYLDGIAFFLMTYCLLVVWAYYLQVKKSVACHRLVEVPPASV
ncbi:uncharacterized protein LOC125029428 [Penaeus chinensis]|uniref:uncharacterized protein LOC125029428 n=1 Tax=Penaeus chinensis TaxID=139456 RepID=UPI001FB84EEC|nr:uncharacterized protein LOC125029428 [Penaeus chinensis]